MSDNTLTGQTTAVPSSATAPVAILTPTIAEELTVSQAGQPSLRIGMTAKSDAGISLITIIGAFGVGNFQTHGAKSATASLVFYDAYYRTGDYHVHMQVVDGDRNVTTFDSVIHVIP